MPQTKVKLLKELLYVNISFKLLDIFFPCILVFIYTFSLFLALSSIKISAKFLTEYSLNNLSTFKLFGLSLATINALISLFIIFITIYLFKNEKNK